MSKVKFDSESMKLIALFESMTGANVRDCINDEKLIFIIGENEMGKAIGRNGANIKRMENSLKRKIKLVEYSSDVLQFIRNAIRPIEVLDINYDSGIITIRGKDSGSKAMLIGRERRNINHLTGIVKRYFDVKEIRVV